MRTMRLTRMRSVLSCQPLFHESTQRSETIIFDSGGTTVGRRTYVLAENRNDCTIDGLSSWIRRRNRMNVSGSNRKRFCSTSTGISAVANCSAKCPPRFRAMTLTTNSCSDKPFASSVSCRSAPDWSSVGMTNVIRIGFPQRHDSGNV